MGEMSQLEKITEDKIRATAHLYLNIMGKTARKDFVQSQGFDESGKILEKYDNQTYAKLLASASRSELMALYTRVGEQLIADGHYVDRMQEQYVGNVEQSKEELHHREFAKALATLRARLTMMDMIERARFMSYSSESFKDEEPIEMIQDLFLTKAYFEMKTENDTIDTWSPNNVVLKKYLENGITGNNYPEKITEMYALLKEKLSTLDIDESEELIKQSKGLLRGVERVSSLANTLKIRTEMRNRAQELKDKYYNKQYNLGADVYGIMGSHFNFLMQSAELQNRAIHDNDNLLSTMLKNMEGLIASTQMEQDSDEPDENDDMDM